MGKNKKKSVSSNVNGPKDESNPKSIPGPGPDPDPDVEMDQIIETQATEIQTESDTKTVLSLEAEAAILPILETETNKIDDKMHEHEESSSPPEKKTPDDSKLEKEVVELKEIQIEKDEEPIPSKSPNCSKGWCAIL